MLPEDKFFQTNDEKKIWQRYCGFLDLSMEEFMEIQNRLLIEQMELVASSILGKKIMQGNSPKTVDEFRRLVPVTAYKDYEPYMSKQQEDVLAEKPYFWCHSSGRGGAFKWVPYTRRGFEVSIKRSFGVFMLACANSKYDINFKPGCHILALLPPPPYTSGANLQYGTKHLSLRIIPSFEKIVALDFQKRIAAGFEQALEEGVDVVTSASSVIAKVGEKMVDHAQKMQLSPSFLRPRILFKVLRGLLISKLARRPMLPRDLLRPKGIVTAGPDIAIYRDKITYYWGRVPHELYGGSEANPIATQSLSRKGMTFVPDICFWEFIPEAEYRKNRDNPEYQPSTVLLNEVEAGQNYEIVLSQFYGMPMLRYRIGDLITIIAKNDEQANVQLPQMVFKSRTSDVLNLAGLVEIDEMLVWKALEQSGVKYEEWSARKEYEGNQAYLRLYIELKEQMDAAKIEQLVDQQLKTIDVDYRDMEAMLGMQPVRVILLTPGTFHRYFEEQQKAGADLAHLKPPHMNASNNVIEGLLVLSHNKQG